MTGVQTCALPISTSVYLQTSGMPSAARAKIFDIAGIQSKVLPARKWVNHATGRGAQEVGVDFIRGLVPKGSKLSDDVLSQLGDNIVSEGFLEAGEIVISRTDGTIHIADGVKRFLAVEELNKGRATAEQINRIPMRLRFTDDASSKVAQRMGPETLEKAAKDGLSIDRLKNIADDTAVADAELGTFDVDRLADSMKKNGFDKSQPVEVKYNRVLDQILITDGNKRLLAAELVGIKKLPVKIIETTDDLAIAPTGLPFVSPVKRYTDFFDATGGGRLPSVGVSLDKAGIKLKKGLKDLGSGDSIVRPDSAIPGKNLLGEIDKAAITDTMEQAAMNGWRIQDGMQSIINASLRGSVSDSLLGRISTEVKSFFTQANTVRQLPTHGPGAYQRIMDQVVKIAGDDVAKADEWIGRIMEQERASFSAVAKDQARFAALEPLLDELYALIDDTCGALDGFVED